MSSQHKEVTGLEIITPKDLQRVFLYSSAIHYNSQKLEMDPNAYQKGNA
jgi:hypothetical protein